MSLLLLLFALGCHKDEIEVYQVPKEASTPFAGDSASGGGVPEQIQWTLPAGWEEQPATKMRVANFSIQKDGKQAEAAIIPLQGMRGKEVDVVNLWRQQVGLPPLNQEQTKVIAKQVQVGRAEGRLFEMPGKDPSGDKNSKERMLVAMVERGGVTWFFKLTGEDSLVADQKPTFLNFLKSVEFQEAPETSRMASTEQAAPQGNPRGAPPASRPQWEIPPDWHEQAAGQMLLASYLVTGAQGKANVTVSSFPGPAGGELGNVNRWRKQLGLAPIAEAELSQNTTRLDVLGGQAMLIDISGVDAKTGQKARLVAAMVPRSGSTWFYKLMGDDPVVAKQIDAFVKFVQTVRYSDNG